MIPNAIIYYLCGFAVPFFFMASGFFLLNRGKIDYSYSKKKVGPILKIVIIWNSLYCLVKIIEDAVMMKQIRIIYILNIPIQCINSLIQRGFFWQFWYLGALIIVYLLLPCISKISSNAKRNLTIILGAFSIFLQIVSLIKGYPIQKNVIQTFRIWTWLLYFLLGGIIGEKYNSHYTLPLKIHLLLYIVYTIVLLRVQIYISSNVIKYTNAGLQAEYFYDSISGIIWIILGFTLFYRVKIGLKGAKIIKKFSEVLMGVYIVHPVVIRFLSKFIEGNTLFDISLLFCLTVFLSVCVVELIKRIPVANLLVKL